MKGVYTALISPFNEDGSIDEQSLVKIVKLQEEAEIDGLVLGGTTGEGWSLSDDEIKTSYNICRAHFSKKIIVGASGISTKEAIRKTEFAKEIGADTALVMVPFYNLPSEEGVIDHYKEVAKVGLPIMAYHHPKRTSIKLSIEALKEICSIEEVKSLKDSSSDETIFNALSNCTDLFSGNDDEMKWAKEAGAIGVVSVVSNILPKEVKAFFENDESDAEWEYSEFLENLYLESNPTGIKAAMSHEFLCKDKVRMPLKPYSEWAKNQLYKVMEKKFHKEIANK